MNEYLRIGLRAAAEEEIAADERAVEPGSPAVARSECAEPLPSMADGGVAFCAKGGLGTESQPLLEAAGKELAFCEKGGRGT